MNECKEAPTVDIVQLFTALDRYISTNQHSRDVRQRWLASALIPMKDIAGELRYGRMLPQHEANVNQFRLIEIEGEKQSNQRAIETLDREADKLRGQSK